MFNKIALVIVTVTLVFVLFGKTCHRNSVRKYRHKTYPVFVVTDTSQNVRDDTKVLLNGEEIGNLIEVSSIDSAKVLALNIYDDVEIPSGAFVNYQYTLSGAYIYFTFPQSSVSRQSIMPHDTVTMESAKQGKFDSASAKILVNAVHEILKQVDSTVKQNKVIRHDK